jgi:hypothetical protein
MLKTTINARMDMNFFFKQKKALTLDTMSKDTKKYIMDIMNTRVKNTLYYIIYLFEPRIIEMHGRKDIGGCWQSPPKTNFETMRCTKKNIMGVKKH